MKSRLTLFLLTVLFSGSICTVSVTGQGDQDLAQLLELQLTDAQQENARLQSALKERSETLEQLRAEGADSKSLTQTINQLSTDNDELAAELKKRSDSLESLAREKKLLEDQLEDFRDELKMMESESKAQEEAAGDLSELKAMCRNLEDENSILKQKLTELTDLLARVENERDQAEADFEAMFSEGQEKGSNKNRSDKVVSRLQSSLKMARSEISKLDAAAESAADELRAAKKEVADQVANVQREADARQSAEADLERMKSNEEQREHEMDDVLSRMASAEKLNKEQAAELTEREATISENSERVESLQNELTRMTATDEERREAMDKLLLDMSEQEAAYKKATEKLAAQLAEAKKEIAALKSAAEESAKSDSPDIAEERNALESENKDLQKQVATLEARLADASKDAAVAGDNERAVKSLEAALQQSRKDSAELEHEILSMRKAAEEQSSMVKSLKENLAKIAHEKAQLVDKAQSLRNRKIDVRNSDLFKEMEQLNVALREKLVQVESERQRKTKALKKLEARDAKYDNEIDHEKQLRQKAELAIADARARELEYQELIERLMAQVPQLEKQVAELEGQSQKLTDLLVDREEDLKALKSELEKRDHRLVKAERVAEVLENAREDVIHANDQEKLNMYYNMAAMHARDGKFREAEQAYLRALRLDPTDADVHYNLGILYDDELKSPAKAVVHYRRYLKLNPHGPEADQVRDWLMKLDMKMKQ